MVLVTFADREDNPVYKALKKKAKQVKGAANGTLKCIFLVDAGCDLLRRLRPMGGVNEISGEEILHHALSKLSIDVVVVLSPLRRRNFVFTSHSEILWKVNCFDSRHNISDGEYDRIRQLAAQLPKPKFEAYLARDIHIQGGFAGDGRNWHLPTHITTRQGGKMTIKLSASLLHEYLAGRIDANQFKDEAFTNDRNYFAMELTRGNAIRNAQFESGGIDEDDDYVIFDLDIDWDKIAKRKPN